MLNILKSNDYLIPKWCYKLMSWSLASWFHPAKFSSVIDIFWKSCWDIESKNPAAMLSHSKLAKWVQKKWIASIWDSTRNNCFAEQIFFLNVAKWLMIMVISVDVCVWKLIFCQYNVDSNVPSNEFFVNF